MMTWLLTWLNVSVAKLNAMLQLLEREREREAFVSGKIEIMHGIREGMTILQYEDKNKKSQKQRKIKRQNNSNIESSGDMKS